LANVPIRRGAANGSTQVAKMKNLNNQPDNANQRKKIVCTKILRVRYIKWK